MTSSVPLDLSMQTVRSADHDHDHDRNQPQPEQPQMLSRQLQLDKATRRARRGRHRSRLPATAPAAICSDPAAAPFSDTLSRQYEPAMFAELDTGVDDCGEDRNKATSWRMDGNSPVSALADDSVPAVPYGRRGKTGQSALTLSHVPVICCTAATLKRHI